MKDGQSLVPRGMGTYHVPYREKGIDAGRTIRSRMTDGIKGEFMVSFHNPNHICSITKRKYIDISVSQNHSHFFLQTGMIVGKTHFS